MLNNNFSENICQKLDMDTEVPSVCNSISICQLICMFRDHRDATIVSCPHSQRLLQVTCFYAQVTNNCLQLQLYDQVAATAETQQKAHLHPLPAPHGPLLLWQSSISQCLGSPVTYFVHAAAFHNRALVCGSVGNIQQGILDWYSVSVCQCVSALGNGIITGCNDLQCIHVLQKWLKWEELEDHY